VPVDYNDADFLAAVRGVAPGVVAAVFDNVGGDTARAAWAMLAPGGVLVSYAIIDAVSGVGSLWPPFLKHLGRILAWKVLPNGKRAPFYDLWAGHRTSPRRYRRRLEHDLGRVLELVRDGAVTANIAARFPLADVVQESKLAESRTLNGKVILVP